MDVNVPQWPLLNAQTLACGAIRGQFRRLGQEEEVWSWEGVFERERDLSPSVSLFASPWP